MVSPGIRLASVAGQSETGGAAAPAGDRRDGRLAGNRCPGGRRRSRRRSCSTYPRGGDVEMGAPGGAAIVRGRPAAPCPNDAGRSGRRTRCGHLAGLPFGVMGGCAHCAVPARRVGAVRQHRAAPTVGLLTAASSSAAASRWPSIARAAERNQSPPSSTLGGPPAPPAASACQPGLKDTYGIERAFRSCPGRRRRAGPLSLRRGQQRPRRRQPACSPCFRSSDT